jgi:hypothetical protein
VIPRPFFCYFCIIIGGLETSFGPGDIITVLLAARCHAEIENWASINSGKISGQSQICHLHWAGVSAYIT